MSGGSPSVLLAVDRTSNVEPHPLSTSASGRTPRELRDTDDIRSSSRVALNTSPRAKTHARDDGPLQRELQEELVAEDVFDGEQLDFFPEPSVTFTVTASRDPFSASSNASCWESNPFSEGKTETVSSYHVTQTLCASQMAAGSPRSERRDGRVLSPLQGVTEKPDSASDPPSVVSQSLCEESREGSESGAQTERPDDETIQGCTIMGDEQEATTPEIRWHTFPGSSTVLSEELESGATHISDLLVESDSSSPTSPPAGDATLSYKLSAALLPTHEAEGHHEVEENFSNLNSEKRAEEHNGLCDSQSFNGGANKELEAIEEVSEEDESLCRNASIAYESTHHQGHVNSQGAEATSTPSPVSGQDTDLNTCDLSRSILTEAFHHPSHQITQPLVGDDLTRTHIQTAALPDNGGRVLPPYNLGTKDAQSSEASEACFSAVDLLGSEASEACFSSVDLPGSEASGACFSSVDFPDSEASEECFSAVDYPGLLESRVTSQESGGDFPSDLVSSELHRETDVIWGTITSQSGNVALADLLSFLEDSPEYVTDSDITDTSKSDVIQPHVLTDAAWLGVGGAVDAQDDVCLWGEDTANVYTTQIEPSDIAPLDAPRQGYDSQISSEAETSTEDEGGPCELLHDSQTTPTEREAREGSPGRQTDAQNEAEARGAEIHLPEARQILDPISDSQTGQTANVITEVTVTTPRTEVDCCSEDGGGGQEERKVEQEEKEKTEEDAEIRDDNLYEDRSRVIPTGDCGGANASVICDSETSTKPTEKNDMGVVSGSSHILDSSAAGFPETTRDEASPVTLATGEDLSPGEEEPTSPVGGDLGAIIVGGRGRVTESESLAKDLGYFTAKNEQKTEHKREERDVVRDAKPPNGICDSDTPMVTAREEVKEVESPDESDSHCDRTSTLSEVSSNIFESFQDSVQPVDSLLVEKLSELESQTPTSLFEALSEVSEHAIQAPQIPRSTLSAVSDDVTLPAEETDLKFDGEDQDGSLSSEQTNLVLSDFQQMLDDEGSITSSVTESGREHIAEDVCGGDSSSSLCDQTSGRWAGESSSTVDKPVQLNRRPAPKYEKRSEDSLSSPSHRSLLDEIHEFRTHSNTDDPSSYDVPSKADARYEGGRVQVDRQPSTDLVTSRRQFWDTLIAESMGFDESVVPTSSDGIDVPSRCRELPERGTITDKQVEDAAAAQEVEEVSDDSLKEEAPSGLVKRIKVTLDNLFSDADKSPEGQEANELGGSVEPASEPDAGESLVQNRTQVWQNLIDSSEQKSESKANIHKKRDKDPRLSQSEVNKSGLFEADAETQEDAPEEESYADVPDEDLRVTVPGGAFLEKAPSVWEAVGIISATNVPTDTLTHEDSASSQPVDSVNQRDETDGKLRDESENSEGIKRVPSFMEIEKGLVKSGKKLWERKRIEEENKIILSKHSDTDTQVTETISASDGNKENDTPEKELVVTGKGIWDSKDNRHSDTGRIKAEFATDATCEDRGSETSESDCLPIERHPSMKVIERGIVRTRTHQWEGKLPIMEEDESSEESMRQAGAPKVEAVNDAVLRPFLKMKESEAPHHERKKSKKPSKSKAGLGYQLSVKIRDGTVVDTKLLWEARELARKQDIEAEWAHLHNAAKRAEDAHVTSDRREGDARPQDDNDVPGGEERLEVVAPQSSEVDTREVIRYNDPLAEPDIAEGLVRSTKQMWLSQAMLDDMSTESVLKSKVRAQKNKKGPRHQEPGQCTPGFNRSPSVRIPDGSVLEERKKWESSMQAVENREDYRDWKKARAVHKGIQVSPTPTEGVENVPTILKTADEGLPTQAFEGEEKCEKLLDRTPSFKMIERGIVLAGKEMWESSLGSFTDKTSSSTPKVYSETHQTRPGITPADTDVGDAREDRVESTQPGERSPSLKKIEKGIVKSGKCLWEGIYTSEDISKTKSHNKVSVAAESRCKREAMNEIPSAPVVGRASTATSLKEEPQEEVETSKAKPYLGYQLSVKIKDRLVVDARLMWEAREEARKQEVEVERAHLQSRKHVTEGKEATRQWVPDAGESPCPEGQEEEDSEESDGGGSTASGCPSWKGLAGVVTEEKKRWEEIKISEDQYAQWKRTREEDYCPRDYQVVDADASATAKRVIPATVVTVQEKIDALRSDSENYELSETESALQIEEGIVSATRKMWEERGCYQEPEPAGRIVSKREADKELQKEELEDSETGDVDDLPPMPLREVTFRQRPVLRDLQFCSMEVEHGSETISIPETLPSEDETTEVPDHLHWTSSIAACEGSVQKGRKVWEEKAFREEDILQWKLKSKLVFPTDDHRTSEDAKMMTGTSGDAEKMTGTSGDVEKMTGTSGDAEKMTRTSGDAEKMTGTSGDSEKMTRTSGDAEKMTGMSGDAEKMTRTSVDVEMNKTSDESETTRHMELPVKLEGGEELPQPSYQEMTEEKATKTGEPEDSAPLETGPSVEPQDATGNSGPPLLEDIPEDDETKAVEMIDNICEQIEAQDDEMTEEEKYIRGSYSQPRSPLAPSPMNDTFKASKRAFWDTMLSVNDPAWDGSFNEDELQPIGEGRHEFVQESESESTEKSSPPPLPAVGPPQALDGGAAEIYEPEGVSRLDVSSSGTPDVPSPTEASKMSPAEVQEVLSAEVSSPEASEMYSPEASEMCSPRASEMYSPEASIMYSPEASGIASPEASIMSSPEFPEMYSPVYSPPIPEVMSHDAEISSPETSGLPLPGLRDDFHDGLDKRVLPQPSVESMDTDTFVDAPESLSEISVPSKAYGASQSSTHLVSQKKDFWDSMVAKEQTELKERKGTSRGKDVEREQETIKEGSKTEMRHGERRRQSGGMETIQEMETASPLPETRPSPPRDDDMDDEDVLYEQKRKMSEGQPSKELVSQKKEFWDQLYTRKEEEVVKVTKPQAHRPSTQASKDSTTTHLEQDETVTESEMKTRESETSTTPEDSSRPRVPYPDAGMVTADAGRDYGPTPDVQEEPKKNLVAQKKGFWDAFIASREEDMRDRKADVLKKTSRGKLETSVVREATAEGTSLGRKLSITIKTGTVRAHQQRYDVQEEDEYTKWKKSKTLKRRKSGASKFAGTYGHQKRDYPSDVSARVSSRSQETDAHEEKTQRGSQAGDSFRQIRKSRSFRRGRTPSPRPQEEKTSSDEGDRSPPRVRRKTSVKIQKGLVQRYKVQWETTHTKAGFWTWKRQRASSPRPTISSTAHRKFAQATRAVGSPTEEASSQCGNLLPSAPSSRRSKSPITTRTDAEAVAHHRASEPVSAYVREVGMPVQKGRDFWEHERYTSPSPCDVPERPLTPDERQQYLSGVRGKVAQERRRFDSLGSLISTESADSLDSSDHRQEPDASSFGEDYVKSVVGKVSRQRDMWETKVQKMIQEETEERAKVKARTQRSIRRDEARGDARDFLPIVRISSEDELRDAPSPSSPRARDGEMLFYILHNNIQGDMVLETYNDHRLSLQGVRLDAPRGSRTAEEKPSVPAIQTQPPQATRGVRQQKQDTPEGTDSFEVSRTHPKRDRHQVFTSASAAQPPRIPLPRLGQGLNVALPRSPSPTPRNLQAKPSPESSQTSLPCGGSSEEDKADMSSVVASDAEDYYIEYKHNFASARRLFESGLRESDTESTEASTRQIVSSVILPKFGTSSPHKTKDTHPIPGVKDGDTVPSRLIKAPPSGGTLSVPSVPPTVHALATVKERHPTRDTFPRTEVSETVSRESGRATSAEVQRRLQDHGCQTEDQDSRNYIRAYLMHQGCQSDLEELDQTWTRDASSPRDQEIQVYQEDLVNPLKRVVSKRSRKYDLVEMPKMKRRIYRRRHGSFLLGRRSFSAPDVQDLEMALCVQETRQGTSSVQRWSGDPKKSPIKPGQFGIANSSSLVASLMDLAWNLPSAYPDIRHNPLFHDDLADLDPDVFQHFPQEEVIKTLSGCYRGEFPHVPVSGSGQTPSLRGTQRDLISLRELRHTRSLPESLALPPISEQPAPEPEESPVYVIRNPLQPMDPITTQLMREHERNPDGHNTYSQYNSSESLALSSDSAVMSSEGAVVSTDDEGDGVGLQVDSDSESKSLEASHTTPETPVNDSAVAEEASEDLCSEEEEEERRCEEEETREGEEDEERRRSTAGGCRAYGEGLTKGTVSGVNAFIIDTVGADQGEVTVSVEGPDKGLVLGTEVYPLEGYPGVFQVHFRVTSPGHYRVIITWAGQHLPGSPFTCVVEEG
ncbi:uncharacterized protein [Panulirus ornatus]|uniref:uncharacterized protein n=1 Tax=Panulirus ornatus TaxID=150431 RepID=UPI003A8AC008